MKRALALAAVVAACAGCAGAGVPSPLAPAVEGSVGSPARNALSGGVELPRKGAGYAWLRMDDRHYGIDRLVRAIERAAKVVAEARPPAMLAVGDLSRKTGGQLLPHFSHRTGRDADLLLYLTTLEGVPVKSPGFVRVEEDGLAWDDQTKRFLRFDVERTWLLVKTLVEDPEARVQWIFANRNIAALLLEWARARGETGETLHRAMVVLHEPNPGGAHDDHLHVRTACTPEELSSGCDPVGPARSWLSPMVQRAGALDDAALAQLLFEPLH